MCTHVYNKYPSNLFCLSSSETFHIFTGVDSDNLQRISNSIFLSFLTKKSNGSEYNIFTEFSRSSVFNLPNSIISANSVFSSFSNVKMIWNIVIGLFCKLDTLVGFLTSTAISFTLFTGTIIWFSNSTSQRQPYPTWKGLICVWSYISTEWSKGHNSCQFERFARQPDNMNRCSKYFLLIFSKSLLKCMSCTQ